MLDDLMQEVQTIAKSYAFIRGIADLDRTDNALMLRLIIDETMFIQVYANSKKRKLNFALIGSGQRIFGRDSEGGKWHKHPFESPQNHESEGDAGKTVALTEFVMEVEELLLEKSLL
ncbi:MAG: hypothetical protein AAGU11_24015 [Syntrophobacteraceae bacterium]